VSEHDPAPPPPSGPHGYAPPPKPATGALPWALGFLLYIPIPVVSAIITGVVMAAVYGSQRRLGPVAAGNARNAANWGLTLILGTVVSFGSTAILAALLHDTVRGFFPIGTPILLYLALCVAHLVVIIVGLARASRGQVFENRIAIPFIRR
jgi:uncharacterized Tic20 family protein